MKRAIITIFLTLVFLLAKPSEGATPMWDTSFSGDYPTYNGNATAVLTVGTNVYVGTDSGFIWKWNLTGWTNFAGGIDGPIRFLAASSGTLYIGGTFDTYWDGQQTATANNILKASLSTSLLSTLGTGSNVGVLGTIYCMVTAPQSLYRHDVLYVGGVLTAAGGAIANNVASWNGSNWSPMHLGLTFGDPTQTGKGVWSLCTWQNPGFPATVYILATGRFEQAYGTTLTGPNIARFSEDSSGNSSWSSVGVGISTMVIDPTTCSATRQQGYDCFVKQAVSLSSGTAYMDLFDVSQVGGTYQLDTCLNGMGCVCGKSPHGYEWAKAGVSSGTPVLWDGGNGWYPNSSPEYQHGEIWSDGATIYGFITAYGSYDAYVGKYVSATSGWTNVSGLIPAAAIGSPGPNHFMAKSSTAIYLALGGIPQRWIL